MSEGKMSLSFLDDSPISEDKLGLHENITNVIKNIIKLTQNSGNQNYRKKIIGLFGSWGSGKSTVVEILKKDLGDEKVFVFDSWSHKGDFLKRAFLLELASKLEVKEEEYKEEKKDNLTIETVLTRKIINKTVDSKPLSKLDNSIKVLTSILILSILIVAFFKVVEYLILPFIPHSWIEFWKKFNYNWALGILIFIALVATVLAKKELINKALNDFINFYFLKKTNITESHTTRENLEFTNYDYGEYLRYILQKAKEKRRLNDPFIVVFDNLDRVDDETVLNTLSLIQLTNEVLNKSKFNNIYFLIPIDRKRLEKTIKTIIVRNGSDDAEREKFARDFLEKIFPYKVNIPSMNHSDWREFFREQMEKAFGIFDEYKILFIRRVFELAVFESKNDLTPREIKNFINSLVENCLYWQNLDNSLNLELQALYVSLNKYLNEELTEFVGKIEKTKNFQEIINESNKNKLQKIINFAKKEFSEREIGESLLKQYYRTDKIYTLFVDQFNRAVEDKDVENINQIVKLLGDSSRVIDLVNTAIELKSEYRSDINSLLKLSYSIQKSKLRGIFSEYYEKYVIEPIKSLITNVEDLSKLDIRNVHELKDIIDSNEEIREIFLGKSVEIIKLTSWEERNET